MKLGKRRNLRFTLSALFVASVSSAQGGDAAASDSRNAASEMARVVVEDRAN